MEVEFVWLYLRDVHDKQVNIWKISPAPIHKSKPIVHKRRGPELIRATTLALTIDACICDHVNISRLRLCFLVIQRCTSRKLFSKFYSGWRISKQLKIIPEESNYQLLKKISMVFFYLYISSSRFNSSSPKRAKYSLTTFSSSIPELHINKRGIIIVF